jgi:hypothetical protein
VGVGGESSPTTTPHFSPTVAFILKGGSFSHPGVFYTIFPSRGGGYSRSITVNADKENLGMGGGKLWWSHN